MVHYLTLRWTGIAPRPGWRSVARATRIDNSPKTRALRWKDLIIANPLDITKYTANAGRNVGTGRATVAGEAVPLFERAMARLMDERSLAAASGEVG